MQLGPTQMLRFEIYCTKREMEIQQKGFKNVHCRRQNNPRTNHSRIDSTDNYGFIITADKDDILEPQGPKWTLNFQIVKNRKRWVCERVPGGGLQCRESPKHYKNKATLKNRRANHRRGSHLVLMGDFCSFRILVVPSHSSVRPPQMTRLYSSDDVLQCHMYVKICSYGVLGDKYILCLRHITRGANVSHRQKLFRETKKLLFLITLRIMTSFVSFPKWVEWTSSFPDG